MYHNTEKQLVDFLKDMYSVEQQALAQMVSAPKLADDPSLATAFSKHHAETEQQAALVLARLEAHGETPSAIQGAIMKLGGKGFLLFAGLQPETPGRLTAHAYAYEAMEWAGYEMLGRFAEAAGDTQTAAVARTIRDQERVMMERLESGFDAAEQASHRKTDPGKMDADIIKHINEAHALESQAIKLLSKSQDIAEDAELAAACRLNLADAHKHSDLLEQRLAALGGSSSSFKDAALALFGLNWGFFFQAQSDTPAKLAAFAYAFEHLKIAGYELLKRSARRAGDAETERLCESLVADEQSMVARLTGTFDSAAAATLSVAKGK
jgi:ferritin-like metal-binding protein YciE